jgi:hypothetical protein
MAGDNPIVLVRFIDEGFPLMGVGAKGVSPLLQLKVISDHFFDSQPGKEWWSTHTGTSSWPMPSTSARPSTCGQTRWSRNGSRRWLIQ